MSSFSWTSSLHVTRGAVTVAGLALSLAAANGAEPLPAPEGPVILLVSGDVGVTNTPEGAAFDRQMLTELGMSEIHTSTPWTDGVQVFEGVLARTLFERVGGEGALVKAAALNDYTVEIPMDDFLNYDVLLAIQVNGEEMRVSDKGPIWIIYPRDDFSELQNRELNDRWVWQLKSLEVQ
ncbi:MAG: molybdopterin-dependent oxidoreductase [Candidatus Devosia phytovorans]|uniref:Molybdopterin-dependent oxidoreductase n=1 Tax=Candidatus Devosia phytovorans TaxID=3121372 RepID=A0AAJ5VYW5_9HYPH|nr:molybdopterin-dependent oxidoreductase [Devosia sp.]WEK06556.1 MAG: molybdopterin-dependent oxidoreductase [Devosia sp.]